MPPPTPLSGCPLKRLDIRDRCASKVYDAAESDAALTLSLEGQRSPSGDRNDLVLQAHRGLQRVLSFQLNDLLTTPSGKTDAVSIDKISLLLCVKSQQHNQSILAMFGEARDFNVAACMLKKFGFQVKDGIPAPDRSSSNQNQDSMTTSGPRLSSITPLSWPGAQEIPQGAPDLSFASMLRSDTPLSQAGAPYGRLSSVPSTGSRPHSPPVPSFAHPIALPYSQPIVPHAAYHSPFNPYHVFLGRQFHQPHQPLVGSPLRHSFGVEGATDPMTMAGVKSSAHPSPSRLGMLQDGRSVSVPIVPYIFYGSQSSQLSEGSQPQLLPGYHHAQDHVGGPLSQGTTSSLRGSHDTSQSSGWGGFSQTSIETSDLSQLNVAQDIHDLMPRPRELPFEQRTDKADRTQKSSSKAAVKPKAKVKTKTQTKQDSNSRLVQTDGAGRKSSAKPTAKTSRTQKASARKPVQETKDKSSTKTRKAPSGTKNTSRPALNNVSNNKAADIPEKPEKVPVEEAEVKHSAHAKRVPCKSESASKPKPSLKKGVNTKPAEITGPRSIKKPAPKATSAPKKTAIKKKRPTQISKASGEAKSGSEEKDNSKEKESKPPAKRTRKTTQDQEPIADRCKRCKNDPAPPSLEQVHETATVPDPTADQPVSSQTANQGSSRPSTMSPLEGDDSSSAIAPPTMLLTDHDALQKINRATSKLLEQYEADIARCGEAGPYARFYAERIHSVRRDFWAAELAEAADRRHLVLSDV